MVKPFFIITKFEEVKTLLVIWGCTRIIIRSIETLLFLGASLLHVYNYDLWMLDSL